MAQEHIFGIDLGTRSVKIYDQKYDKITQESNSAAIRNGDTVFAIGNEAYEMLERTPDNIEIVNPSRNGRINDVLMQEAILHILLERTTDGTGHNPTLYFSVPTDMTEIERRAYSTIAQRGRFRRSKVYMVEKPIADAVAIGIPIERTQGSIIINMGAQSTEVSVIADKRPIISRMIPIGGQHFTEAIVEGIRKKNAFTVSFRTAEHLKFELCNMSRDIGEGLTVGGLDMISGLPRNGSVSSYNVTSCVANQLTVLTDEIRTILERIPPQVRTNSLEEGIFLTGGSSRIPGIERFMEYRLGISCTVSRFFEYSTAYGLKQIIDNKELQNWVYIPGKKN
ncbi:MAG: rod shape-determining protein [Eubacteriales bacterium]|nr:rod shape-determining protein [Eubacteriales bacterium]